MEVVLAPTLKNTALHITDSPSGEMDGGHYQSGLFTIIKL